MKLRVACVVIGFLSLVSLTVSQTSAQISTQTASALPRLVRFAGTAKDLNGSPMTGVVGITFAFYSEKTGGSPLWLETQNATADSTGHYTVLLGSTKPEGLPAELFTSEQARWVGVQVSGQPEQPRVLLVSAPYALKAGDAETIGGLPPSAFVLAAPLAIGSTTSSSTATVPPPAATDVTTTGGTLNFLPIFSGAATIIDSAVFQTGTGATAKVGINTTTPATTLDLNGGGTIRGTLALPATAAATATAGKDSQPLSLAASAFNSTSSTALPQVFHLQAEPAGNDTTAPSGTLNLLFGEGATAPSETGLKISSKGLVTFAAGQTFPGTGTVTSVIAGAGLTGGTITKTGTISLAAAGVTNADLAHDSLTITAGTDLTGGGLVALGGATTLNLNTTKVPLLAAANTFTANQTVNAKLTATTFSGNGAAVTNVDATALGGIAASGYPTLTGINIFDGGFADFEGAWGSWEVEVINSGGGNGIIAENTATTGTNAGVYGSAPNSTVGIGVFGQQGSESGEGSTVSGLGRGVGVWGDGGTTSPDMGVVGSADDGDAGYFRNNSSSGWQTVWIEADNSATNVPFEVFNSATGGSCDVDSNGNLNCTGSKNAIVPIDSGARTVAMSAIEAPQNWFEDAGSAELANGVAIVTLDRDFIQTVNTEIDYKVFPVPNGDCKGLYVTNKTATSFEIRELGGGTSNVRFDYRIMALRRKYENVRFADHTRDLEQTKKMQMRALTGPRHPHTPNLNSQPRPASAKAILKPTATMSQTR
jgi:hypothetical protein